MPQQPLNITLTLDKAKAVEGESVPFVITILNPGPHPAQIVSPGIHNTSLALVAIGDGQTRRGRESSALGRSGIHEHGPRQALTESLPPGGKKEIRGDSIAWLGVLPPGKWKVVAEYVRNYSGASSPHALLEVTIPAAAALHLPDHGQGMPTAPLTSVWFNRAAPGDKTLAPIYTNSDARLPRSTVRGVRLPDLPEKTETVPAQVPRVDTPVGHLLWQDGDKVMVAGVNLRELKVMPTIPVTPPFPGKIARTAVSLESGACAFAFISDDAKRFAVLTAGAGNAVAELDLGKASPIGVYSLLWDYDARAHMAWTGANLREVWLSTLLLTVPEAVWSTPTPVQFELPVAWMDGYIHLPVPGPSMEPFKEADEGQPEAVLPEPPPTEPHCWVVCRRGEQYVCLLLNMRSKLVTPRIALDEQTGVKLRIIDSAVTSRQHLALLLADPAGELYYTTTAAGRIEKLSKFVGRVVNASQSPRLQAASNAGMFPWVYVRFLDPETSRVLCLKVEPVKERDPMDKPPPAPVVDDFPDDEEMAPAGAAPGGPKPDTDPNPGKPDPRTLR